MYINYTLRSFLCLIVILMAFNNFPLEAKTPKAVDLGLSVKWADCNLGAILPEDNGDPYAWGELNTKSNFKWYDYSIDTRFREIVNLDQEIPLILEYNKTFPKYQFRLKPQYDVCTQTLGKGWRIPTPKEWQELIETCKIERIKEKGKRLIRITAPNGNIIFLPITGRFLNDRKYDDTGEYWSSDGYLIQAYDSHPGSISVRFNKKNHPAAEIIASNSDQGRYIRAVYDPYFDGKGDSINPKPNPAPVKNLASMTWLDYNPTTESKNYSFRIGIKSDSKIEDVSVDVNGTLTRGIKPVFIDDYNMTINKTVALNEGQNTIKVTVKNAGGTSTSEKTVNYQIQSGATIEWIAFSPTTTEKQYNLKAGIKSNSKIESCIVTLNGVTERGINPIKNDGYDMTIDKILTLAEGSNEIKIEVRNAAGTIMSEKNITYKGIDKKPIVQQKRIALVMGNADYVESDKKLKNPVNDAVDVAAKLENLGFTVIRSLDQTQQGMEIAINDFGNKAKDYDVALFYYAGHGVQCQGNNYLIPIDAHLPEESYVPYKCTNVNLVLDLMEKSHCGMKIVILDACRNNPFARSWNRGVSNGGLNVMTAPRGTFIAFSTAPGDVAQDGQAGERNSPYTSALLQTLEIPNLSINDFFQEVLEKVATKTNDRQNPWVSGSFRGKFIFNQK